MIPIHTYEASLRPRTQRTKLPVRTRPPLARYMPVEVRARNDLVAIRRGWKLLRRLNQIPWYHRKRYVVVLRQLEPLTFKKEKALS